MKHFDDDGNSFPESIHDEVEEALESEEALEPEQDDREKYLATSGGIPLSWWLLEDGAALLPLLADAVESTRGLLHHMDELERAGLPSHLLPANVTFNMRNGPLVLAGLQMLGALEPDLRDDVAEIIAIIGSSIPDPTESEEKVLEEVHAKMVARDEAMVNAILEAQADEAALLASEQFDARNS